MAQIPALPIDDQLAGIVDTLAATNAMVVEAAPGAGKTTRIPPAFLQAGWLGGKEILVLEPRRLAARLAAERVAEELGERTSQTVGYQFRFESVGGPQTRIRFLTEGIFLRRLLSDPNLRSAGAVIIDEFHERHLQGDLALALLRRLQQTSRPDLRLVVMSATLDGEAVARFLDDCPVIKKDVPRFPVDIEHVEDYGDKGLEERVAEAARHALGRREEGHVLVFLPGVGEIRLCAELLERKVGNRVDIAPLYADLSRDEQERAVRGTQGRRRIVLATNVAETSVTIPGITVVIDSGLARVPEYNHWTGLPQLKLTRISQASATQRAGRAGRTGPGLCIRLYSQGDFAARAPFQSPEIERLELTGTLLELKALGVDDPNELPWFTPPPPEALTSAESLLRMLGALTGENRLTYLGLKLARIPAHPRIGRLMLEGARLGLARETAALSAWLSESTAPAPHANAVTLVDHLREGRSNNLPNNLKRTERQLTAVIEKTVLGRSEKPGDLGQAVLAAFPDRVGRVRPVDPTLNRGRADTREVLLCGGGTAEVTDPALPGDALVVAIDAEERAQGARTSLRLRLYAPIEADWLLELEPSMLEDRIEVVWNQQAKRAEVFSRWTWGKVVIEEQRLRGDAVPREKRAEASRLLADRALSEGMAVFVDVEAWSSWRARLKLAAELYPDAGFLPVDDNWERGLLEAMAEAASTFSDIRALSPLDFSRNQLTQAQQTLLDRQLPAWLSLPRRKRLPIHYESDRAPWAASRLQDFFGMTDTPRLCDGRVELVLHLLAPNQRAVQVTTDLKSFWANTYPSLYKQLSRRYPRHAWPENPLDAGAEEKGKR